MTHKSFVYDTLKHGFHNHYILEQSDFVGTGWTAEKYAMYHNGIPYVVKDEPVSSIQGEVYSIDDETLGILDQLERHPEWYCREEIEVAMDSADEILVVWLYFNPTPDGKLVPSRVHNL